MEKKKWQLQEAKNKFSHVAEQAVQYGPQIVTKHGEDAVVILSMAEYQRLLKPKVSLASFLKTSPLAGSSLELERDHSAGRELNL